MIPLKLHLKNFVSYGATTQIIDFAPYQLICLSGKNGHGKSALLDALTWAIWGQARKTTGVAKADDGLVRIGQTHMLVSLDFLCNGTLYRVRREYTAHTNKPFTGLDFGIVDPTTGLLKALTDKTIRITQDKIETMIGLDYESFVNSAFLRQGQSNEFSKKSPKDRKEILAIILGLDHFERMRKLASDRVKEAANQQEHLEKIHDQIKIELAQKESTLKRLTELKGLLQALNAKETEVKTAMQELKEQHQEVAEIKAKAERIAFQKEQLAVSIKEQTGQTLQEIQKYRHIKREQKSTAHYKQLDKERKALEQELLTFQARAQQKIALKETIIAKKEAQRLYMLQLEQAHQHNLEKYKLQIQEYKLQEHTTAQQLKDVELRTQKDMQEHTKVVQDLAHITKASEHNYALLLEQEEKTFERRKAYYHAFIAQGNTLSAELKNIAHKKFISQTAKKPVCPLCEQDLSPEYKKSLQCTLEKQESLANHQLERITRVLKNLKELLVEHNNHIEQLRASYQKQKIDDVKQIELEKNKAKLSTSLQELETLTQTLKETLTIQHKHRAQAEKDMHVLCATFEQTVKQDAAGQTFFKEIQTAEQALEEFTHDGPKEAKIRERLQELTYLQRMQAELIKEIALQEQRKLSIEQAIKHIKQLKAFKLVCEEESKTYSFYKEREAELMRQDIELCAKLQRLSQEKELVIHQKGALEQLATTIEQREKEYKEQQITIKNLERTAQEYTAIAAALGKDGIQALLIEDAIPEIEQEANALLARLTDNQAHLTIESLRDLRSGKTKETLDIKISDPIGLRPYELFSGGEAFRIDFALRIAISKLLARRAGTALQTLIIDEGFGSQDEEGLSNIMEALHKIQDDFAKVIVVSHLPALKEQFPVHFLVYKTAQGSSIKVIEQG